MNLEEFIFLWESTLPDVPEFEPEVKNLLGFAYYGEMSDFGKNKNKQTINFIDPLSIPNDPIKLFEKLFQIKKKVLILIYIG